MVAEIICVGTELLLGDVLNTNTQYLARELAALGTTVHYQTVVGDNMERLVDTLRFAFGRSELVITTGGLGPTADDITCEGICRALGIERKLHEPSLERIHRYFECAKRHMSENNRKQAMLPEGCEVFDNTCGTAPGCVVEKNGQAVMMLPGPPNEMRTMFEKSGRGWIAARSDQVIVSHTLHVFGIGEASAEQMASDLLENDNPTVAPYAKCAEMEFRVTARAHTAALADALCEPTIEELRRRLGGAVYATDMDSLESVVLELLRKTGKKVTFAESCTGGLLAKRLTDLPGASEVFENSFVTYSNERKRALLGVPGETLRRFGAVSRETACAMAIGARRAGQADYAAAITGIAGPGGGTADKPVGLAYVAVTDGDSVWVREVRYASENGRAYIRHGAASHALNLLRLLLLGDETFLSQGIPLSGKCPDKAFRKAILPVDTARDGQTKKRGFCGFLSSVFPWKGDRAGNVIFKLFRFAVLALFLWSAWMLLQEAWLIPAQAQQEQQQLQDLYHRAESEPSSLPEESVPEESAIESQAPGEEESEAVSESPPAIIQYGGSFRELAKINPDVRGYISIDGTNIDYPVTQTGNNDYYLNHSFFRRSSIYGNPFFDYRNRIDGTDQNLIIYGHYTKTGQMFAQVGNYGTLSFYQQHPLIQMDTIERNGEWKIFSVFYASTLAQHPDNFNYLRTDFASESDFEAFISDVRARSLYDIPVDVGADDTLLMLSSCSDIFQEARIVVTARRVRDGESAQVDVGAAAVNEDCLMPEIWYQLHPEQPHP